MSQQNTSLYPLLHPTFGIDERQLDDNIAQVIIEPLEQGYGHTLGNALRRVLLTSLPGHAITKVRVEGVDHQYSTLDGLTEDVVQLILNIKGVRLLSDSQDAGKLTLEVKGAKEVVAADIKCSAGYEIANPDHHLASLAKGKTLRVEMEAQPGVGYTMADDSQVEAIGEIAVDALFSPIVRVSYKVEATRVGRRTDYDKLILQVETDGTISPKQAVSQAAKVLTKQFSQVMDPVVIKEEVDDDALSPEEAETLKLTVEELDLPTRIANALRKGGFKTVGDLKDVSHDSVARVKNLGEKSVDIIALALKKKGISLSK